MFTAAQFITVNSWKGPLCPSMDISTKKMWYLHTVGVLLFHKEKSESFVGKWMHLEIMLSEINQTRKLKYLMIWWGVFVLFCFVCLFVWYRGSNLGLGLALARQAAEPLS